MVDGDSGLLAETPADWVAAIDQLMSDEAERARIGDLARRRALLEWSPARQGERYLAILEQIVAVGVTDRSASGWTPVVVDEPPMPVTLEAYSGSAGDEGLGPPDTASEVGTTTPARTGGSRIADLAARGVAGVRRDGLVATVRRAAGKMRRRLTTRTPGG